MTRRKMAETAAVPLATMKRSITVLRYGIPELIALVEDGRALATPAVAVARLPPDEQRRIVADFTAGRLRRLCDGLPTAVLERDRLDRLRRAWNACSDKQRREFLDDVRSD